LFRAQTPSTIAHVHLLGGVTAAGHRTGGYGLVDPREV
jgi:hypothetical protein